MRSRLPARGRGTRCPKQTCELIDAAVLRCRPPMSSRRCADRITTPQHLQLLAAGRWLLNAVQSTHSLRRAMGRRAIVPSSLPACLSACLPRWLASMAGLSRPPSDTANACCKTMWTSGPPSRRPLPAHTAALVPYSCDNLQPQASRRRAV